MLKAALTQALKGNHNEPRATIKSRSPGHPMATEPRGRTGQPKPEFSTEFSKESKESTVTFTIVEDAPDDVTTAVTKTEDGEPVSALPANRATPAGSGAAGEEETEVGKTSLV